MERLAEFNFFMAEAIKTHEEQSIGKRLPNFDCCFYNGQNLVTANDFSPTIINGMATWEINISHNGIKYHLISAYSNRLFWYLSLINFNASSYKAP